MSAASPAPSQAPADVPQRDQDSSAPGRLKTVAPLIMTALLAFGSGSPWWACSYLALTGLVSAWATGRLRDGDLHVPTGTGASDAPSAKGGSGSCRRRVSG